MGELLVYQPVDCFSEQIHCSSTSLKTVHFPLKSVLEIVGPRYLLASLRSAQKSAHASLKTRFSQSFVLGRHEPRA